MKRCEKYSANLQENNYAEVSLIKITLHYGCYPINLLYISQNTFL